MRRSQRIARQGLLVILLSFILSLAVIPVCAPSAEAKTINLGGKAKDDKNKAYLIIELPSMNVSMPKKDDTTGGWRHVRIDAYITPKDADTGMKLDGVKSSIVKHAVEETLPATGFDKLNTPYGGEEAAKKAIRIAAERALGHPFEGDILIRTFLSY
ncbi:MAG TPA: hypothetical protein VM661_16060 [Candidatus Sulfotelmatobacter sp.]|jgi:hypothetical protein|nr:hypothetical protein [Candidatus Sulfotelmatobacter sp.]